MTAELTVTERDVLAELMGPVAREITDAVHRRDAEKVQDLLSGLEWQDMAALVVVLAEEVP